MGRTWRCTVHLGGRGGRAINLDSETVEAVDRAGMAMRKHLCLNSIRRPFVVMYLLMGQGRRVDLLTHAEVLLVINREARLFNLVNEVKKRLNKELIHIDA